MSLSYLQYYTNLNLQQSTKKAIVKKENAPTDRFQYFLLSILSEFVFFGTILRCIQ